MSGWFEKTPILVNTEPKKTRIHSQADFNSESS